MSEALFGVISHSEVFTLEIRESRALGGRWGSKCIKISMN